MLFMLSVWVLKSRRGASPRYIVSLTTIPSRSASLRETIQGLMAQTEPPAYIVVNVPERYERFSETCRLEDLPPGVVINRIGTDYGPATKLLGLSHLGRSDYDVAVVVDDDCYKHPDWARTLLSTVREGSVSSCLLPPDSRPNRPWGLRENCVYGYTGFAVPRRLLRALMPNMVDTWGRRRASCFLVDDDFFTFFLNSHRVPVRSCFYPDMGRINARFLRNPDALFALKGEQSRKRSAQSCKREYCDTCDGSVLACGDVCA